MRRLKLLQKLVRPVVVACLIWAGLPAFADEPVLPAKEEKTDKPATELNKKNILGYRAYRPSDSIFRSRNIDVPGPTLSVPVAPPPRTSKQDLEYLDRQKNWIFVRPGDEKKSATAEELLGTDALKFDDRQSKSVVMRFLENKPARDPRATGANSGINIYGFNRNEPKDPANPQPFERSKKTDADGPLGMRPENTAAATGAPLSLAERWQELQGPRSEKMREENRARMNEFESLFGPQNIVSGNGGFGTLQNNLSSQPTSSAVDDFKTFNRNTAAPTGFRNPARPVSGATFLGQPDAANSPFNPSSTVTPRSEPPKKVGQPAVLPIPKRNF